MLVFYINLTHAKNTELRTQNLSGGWGGESPSYQIGLKAASLKDIFLVTDIGDPSPLWTVPALSPLYQFPPCLPWMRGYILWDEVNPFLPRLILWSWCYHNNKNPNQENSLFY